jgi:23S rRNA (pseudouridine1915-N3)-methyltransferase
MKVRLIGVGHKMPAWVTTAFKEYARRLPAGHQIELVEIPPVPRNKSMPAARAMQKEADAIRRALRPGNRLVLLDERGKAHTTAELANKFEHWDMDGQGIDLVIGGADGLDPSLKQQATETWSLSALTFPHPLVRVILAEQLYRVWSLRHNHPYHRE